MTSHVLRRTSTVLLAVCAAVLAVAMFAGPATATEGGQSGGAAAQEPAGFGSGQWDGMLLAGVGGVLLGLLVFGMSNPGEIHRHGH